MVIKLWVTLIATSLLSGCISPAVLTRPDYTSDSRVKVMVLPTDYPESIVVDPSFIYWSTLGVRTPEGVLLMDNLHGAIWRARKDGGEVAKLAGGLYPPESTAIDQTDIYWGSADGIHSVPKLGGPALTLVAFPVVTTSPKDPRIGIDIALDDLNVYWSTTHGIGKVEKSGAHPAVFQPGQTNIIHLAVDANYVYWTSLMDEGSIMRMTKDGAQLVQLLRQQGDPNDIVIDQQYIYWDNSYDQTEGNATTVKKLALKSGVPILLGRGTLNADRLALDVDHLYWVDGLNFKSLMSLPKEGGTIQEIVYLHGDALGGLAINNSQIFATLPDRDRIIMIQK